MKIVEILKPIIIAPLIKKFCQKYHEAGSTPFQVAIEMQQTAQSLQTYLRAVKDDSGKRIAYLWAYPLGPVLFVQQIYSEHPKAASLLLRDMEKWASKRQFKKIIGLVSLPSLTKAKIRWVTRKGYKQTAVMVEKQLGGDNGEPYEKVSS